MSYCNGEWKYREFFNDLNKTVMVQTSCELVDLYLFGCYFIIQNTPDNIIYFFPLVPTIQMV